MTQPIQRVMAQATYVELIPLPGQATFSFTFPVPTGGLIVSEDYGAGWMLGTALPYSIMGLDTEEGGSITFTQPPYGVGVRKLRIERDTLTGAQRTAIYGSDLLFRATSVNEEQASTLMRLQELLSRTTALSRRIDSILGSWSASVGPFIRAEDIPMAGDGAIDDGPALNAKLRAIATTGGGWFALRAPGGSFFINEPVLVPSGVTLQWLSPISLGRDGAFRMQGALAEDATPYAVTANTASGAATISVTSTGGFVTGSYIAIRTINSGRVHEARVTSIGSGAITFAPALAFAVTIGGTVTRRQVEMFGANGTLYDRVLTMSSASNLSNGDHVQVEDDTICSDIAGTTDARTHIEHARVIDVSGVTVKLDRRLERAYSTAKNARLTKMEPCIGAALIGANITFTENSDSDRIDIFEGRYAVDCLLLDCHVDGGEAYGSSAQLFRFWRSYRCRGELLTGALAKYRDPGEAYGLALYYCTDCHYQSVDITSCRHGAVFIGATSCTVQGKFAAHLYVPIDLHGCNEVDCHLVHSEIDASDGNPAGGVGVSVGHNENMAGSHRCTISDTTIIGAASGIEIYAPSSDVHVFDCRFRACTHMAQIYNQAEAPSLAFGAITFSDNTVEDNGDYVVNIDGRGNGGSGWPIRNLTVERTRVTRARRGYRIRYAEQVNLLDNRVADFTPDAGDYAFNRLLGITYLLASGNRMVGVGRPFNLNACPNVIATRNEIIDQTQEPTFEVTSCPDGLITLNTIVISSGGTKQVLDETGGSNGIRYAANVHHPFTPTKAHVSTGTFQLNITGS